MKLFCYNHEPEWIIGRITNELCLNTKHETTDILIEANTIMLCAPWCWAQYPPQQLLTKKFVVFLHHIVPQKVDLDDFLARDKFVDHYIVPNHFTKAFIEEHSNKPITQICYWLNPDLWTVNINKDIAKTKVQYECTNGSSFNKEYSSLLGEKLTDKFVISSHQRDTEGSDLISPKLEKGPDLFIEAVKNIRKSIDKEIVVLLGGWRRQYVIKHLKKERIKYIHFELPSLETLDIMYSASDLYIVSSRHEGGCQAILECAYKNVPIISRDVGIASKILHSDCIMPVENRFIIPTQEHITHAKQSVDKVLLSKQIIKLDEVLENV